MSPAPDFLGIGAQKAGTTWLYANLSAHPAIWMPPEKEIHFFDEKARQANRLQLLHVRGRGTEDERWRRHFRKRFRAWRGERRPPTLWELRYLLGRTSDDWYRSLFKPGQGRVTGEITPNYMTLAPDDVAHVHRVAPDARLILMIRNPIERAWSGSVMARHGAGAPGEDDSTPATIDSERSRALTDYLGALDRWTACYPAERLFIGFMEDVGRRPRLLLSAICQFLGVGASHAFERAGEVIHRGKASAMPAAAAARLAELYGPLTGELRGRFGGYAGFWAFCADRLKGSGGEPGEFRYPFWKTGLWQEWIAAGGTPPEGIQSGTLDRVVGLR